MWQFFIDIKALFLLRFKPVEEYRYDAVTLTAIILALSLLHSVAMMPIIGAGINAIAFSVCLTLLQWLALSQTMKWFIHFNKAPKLSLAHFVLLSEAIVLPSAFFLWFPAEVSSFVNFTLTMLAFSIQVVAFVRFSSLPLWKILLGYLCYLPVVVVLVSLLLAVFAICGWLDLEAIMKTMEELQKQAK